MIQQFFAARSLRFRFMWVLSICLLALGLLLTIALNSFDRLEQQATRAMVAKDLVADILPPPMYLVELRLLLSEAVEGNVSPDIAASRFEELRKAYDARAKHWQAEPPYGLETSLLGLQHQLALQLFKDAQQNIIKPLQQHDLEDAQQGLQRLHPVYIEHRKAVDVTIVKGNALADESVLRPLARPADHAGGRRADRGADDPRAAGHAVGHHANPQPCRQRDQGGCRWRSAPQLRECLLRQCRPQPQ